MPKAPLKAQFKTKRGNGAFMLEGVDGRSMMARRFREIATAIEADLGGDLTEAQRAIAARAVTLAIWAEDAEAALARGEDFDVATYATAANAMRRLLADLGLDRRAKDVTPALSDYIAGKANG
ncbi:hypothetical protein [uncultured Paracoccus sp.]|uniref:hypothetical protein n=1 Tax=uncultured Paracoccus sp. TaxID=189685 RepID=UPI0025EA7EF6|nr:hypothetical protein [uncultured Paracoccus sp.]